MGHDISKRLVRPAGRSHWWIFAAIVVAGVAHHPAPADAGGGDAAWYDQKAIAKAFPTRFTGEVPSSRYLTMRDGCKIAVDVFLPKGLKGGQRIPTILHQTRYWRAVVYNFPFNHVRDAERLANTRRFFVPRGYAWVSVDVRGSGASFGYRPHEYSVDEIKDGADVVDWIVRQPWSDGQVASTGVSYDGGTAELLASNRHPAVKAIAPLFSMFDPYLEVAFPGGIHLDWFTRVWGSLGQALDRNTIPALIYERFGPIAKLVTRGVRPVEGDADRSILAEAVRSHRYNWNLHETSLRIAFRDDRIPYDWVTGFDALSPYVRVSGLDASGVAVYSYSAWYDAAFAHAAIKRHLALKGSKHRLTLGPWNHGGKRNCSPWSPGRSRFNIKVELLRFFEHHLRNADTGIAGEKPVHYYTMGEDRWKAADTWPPPAETRRFYLGADGSLSTSKPTSPDAADPYTVDDTHGTGEHSRWNCLVMGGRVAYYDRKKQDEKLLCYTSVPLAQDTEVTGHPIVTLHVTSPARDGNVFVYLEDVDEKGRIRCLTEGMLRAIHRKLSDQPPPYPQLVPYRTFRRADAMPLVPGKPAALTFDLLPISHLFRKGHRIRLAIAGADVDHFANPPGPPPKIRVHRSAALASHVVLPCVRGGAIASD